MIFKKAVSLISIVFIFITVNGISAETSKKWTPKLTMKVKTISDVQISPDNKKVLYSARSADMKKNQYVSQFLITDIDSKKTHSLTEKSPFISSPRWSSDGKTIAFLSSRTGINNIWVMKPDGDKTRQLTDVKQDIAFFKWSPKGDKIAFAMQDPLTKSEKKAIKGNYYVKVAGEFKKDNIWLVDVKINSQTPGPVRKLTSGNFTVSTFAGNLGIDWSPNGENNSFCTSKSPWIK